MSYCINCGNQLTENDKFCNACGTKVSEAAPEVNTYAQETVQPYYVPAKPAEIVVSTKDKVLGFVGMGLSIGGLVFAIFGIFATLIGMAEEGIGFGMSIGYGIFSLPLSIASKILAGQSKNAGNTSAAVSVGSGIGLAGIIVSGVMLLLGFINLFA